MLCDHRMMSDVGRRRSSVPIYRSDKPLTFFRQATPWRGNTQSPRGGYCEWRSRLRDVSREAVWEEIDRAITATLDLRNVDSLRAVAAANAFSGPPALHNSRSRIEFPRGLVPCPRSRPMRATGPVPKPSSYSVRP
jgi:hypothetical protein